MKKTLEILAVYNKGVNDNVAGILEKLPDEQLKRDMHAYFKSIFDTFLHMTMSDINGHMRLKSMFPNSALSKSPFLQTTVDDMQSEIVKNHQHVFSIRRTADQLYIEFIGELQEEEFDKVISYKSRAGVDMSHKLGNSLLHLFNHQTHHRGAISAMLDMQGVGNDYSGLLKYI